MKVMKVMDNFENLFDLRVTTMLVVIRQQQMGGIMKTTTGPTTGTMIKSIIGFPRNIIRCSV